VTSQDPEGDAKGILELRLLARPLEALRDFYGRTLGLSVLEEAADRLTIQAGATRLTFLRGDDANYHFAFNIPENKIEEAREWLSRRVRLLSRFLREVIHFRSWNAHSVYFQDPAGNIVELIARHDLPNASPEPFSQDQILYASEIGLAVDDVQATVAALGSALGLPVYRPGRSFLVAAGDEHRLLIVVKKGRPWLPTWTVRARVHPTAATLSTLSVSRPARYAPAEYPYTIEMR
jgi:catechol-2,3-dioxygenase